MNDHSYNDLISTCLAILGTNATHGEAAEWVRDSTRIYQWPSTAQGWGRALDEIVSAFGNWEILLAAVAPHVRTKSPLEWPQVFSALGRTLEKPQDRFAFVHKILLDHRKRKPRTFFRTCLDNLVHAGIHPASLVVCSYPTMPTSGVQGLMRIVGKTPGFNPLGYDRDSWQKDISAWCLDGFPSGLDGFVASEPILIFPNPQATAASQKGMPLGNRMAFGSDLKVQNARAITSLGNDVHVYGDMELIELEALTHLGNRIRIEGNLIIIGSPALTGLPEDLFVGGLVYIGKPKAGFQWSTNFPAAKRASRSWNMPANPKGEIPHSLKILQGW
jgi:hypothetical protein